MNTTGMLKGQYVITELGYLPIESVQEGTKVYTHKGNFKTVLKVNKTNYVGNALSIRVNGYYLPVRVDKETPLYIYKGKSVQKSSKDFLWIEAENVKSGDFVVFGSDCYVDDYCEMKYAKALGCYAIYGIPLESVDSTVVSFNTKNDREIERCIKESLTPFSSGCASGIYDWSGNKCIYVTSRKLSALCRAFGNSKVDRAIPEKLIGSSKEFLMKFVLPVLKSNMSRDKEIFFKTSGSYKLFMGIQRILLKLNCFTNIYKQEKIDITSNMPFVYYVINTNMREINNIGAEDSWFKKDGYSYHKIVDIEDEEYDGYTYNLDVEDDKSFCNHIITIHN